MAGPDPRETAIKKHLGRWFTAGLTGCTFAKWAIEAQRVLQLVVLDPIDDSIVDVFNAHVRVAAEDHQLALMVLPGLTDEAAVVDLLQRLRGNQEWSASASDSPDGDRNAFVVDLRWRKPNAADSSVIGFAPFAAMPITRRSPFVTLGVWPLGHSNQLRKKPMDYVGMGDMEHGFAEAEYKKMIKQTVDSVNLIRSLPGGKNVETGISFRLPGSFRSSF